MPPAQQETIRRVIGQKNLNIILHYENIVSFYRRRIELNNELAKDRVRTMRGMLARVSNFLIYVLNNALFVKGRDSKYLRNTSHLFIDQIEADAKTSEVFLGDLNDERSNGGFTRLRKPAGTVPNQRKRLRPE